MRFLQATKVFVVQWVDIAKDLTRAKSFKEAWWLVWGSPTEIARKKVAEEEALVATVEVPADS